MTVNLSTAQSRGCRAACMRSSLVWPLQSFSPTSFLVALVFCAASSGQRSTDPLLDQPDEHSRSIWCEVTGAMRCLPASDLLLFEAREFAGLPQASLQGCSIPVPGVASLGICSRIRIGKAHARGSCWTALGRQVPCCSISLAENTNGAQS